MQPLDESLWSMDDVLRSDGVPGALRVIADWVLSYVNKPHPRLGRPGIVCPFVPFALRLKTMWLALAPDNRRSEEDICQLLEEYTHVYQSRAASVKELGEFTALIVVFPALAYTGVGALVQEVHRRTKPAIVSAGLMLGEFYPESDAPGIHNAAFQPLRSPCPCFVFRQMVVNDLMFLLQSSHSPQQRQEFVQAYVRHLGTRLSAEQLREALAAESRLSKLEQ